MEADRGGCVGPAGKRRFIMVSNTARKAAARDLSRRTGMKYTAALRHVTATAEPREPRWRWVLTDEIRAFFAGEGWHGAYFEDLYGWLDRLTPEYDCDWCGEPGNARTQDSSIKLAVASYDPDLSPVTQLLFTYKHHAACQPSAIAWARLADIPRGPFRITMPARAQPEDPAELDLTATPLLLDDERATLPVLLLLASVVDDVGQDPLPWLNEFQLMLTEQGFAPPDDMGSDAAAGWGLRIADDYPSSLAPQWIALRMPPAGGGSSTSHLYLGALDLPQPWIKRARQNGAVVVLAGPVTSGSEIPDLTGLPRLEALRELIDGNGVTGIRIRIAAGS
jgi:hypothetical protein